MIKYELLTQQVSLPRGFMKKICGIVIALIIITFIWSINFASANVGYDSELGYTCSGNSELIIGCLGDSELSLFIGNYPGLPSAGGGGGGEPINLTNITIIPIDEEKKGIDFGLIIMIASAIGLFIMVLFRKKIKKCWFFIVGDEEEKKKEKKK